MLCLSFGLSFYTSTADQSCSLPVCGPTYLTRSLNESDASLQEESIMKVRWLSFFSIRDNFLVPYIYSVYFQRHKTCGEAVISSNYPKKETLINKLYFLLCCYVFIFSISLSLFVCVCARVHAPGGACIMTSMYRSEDILGCLLLSFCFFYMNSFLVSIWQGSWPTSFHKGSRDANSASSF